MTERLGIDLGTTHIKAMSMTKGGRTQSIETLPMPIQRSGKKVIHSPQSILDQVTSVPNRFRIQGNWEAAIACQRSTFILWNRKDGSPLTPLVSWRDRRAESWIDQLPPNDFQTIRDITGLRPEAGYPLPKICSIRENNEDIQDHFERDEILYGSLDSWLIWYATNGNRHVIDPTQASRTLLFDIETLSWSEELLDRFSIPSSCLPKISGTFDEPIHAKNLWEHGYIVNTIGDQQAATIGGQRPPYDQTRVTLGTAGFIAKSCKPSDCPNSLSLTFTPNAEDQIFQSEGVVLSAGRAMDWFSGILGIDTETMENFVTPPWPEEIPLWCPSLNGVGAPFWVDRPGSVDLLREDTSTKSLCTGLLVSILLRVRDVLEVMPDDNQHRILLDGGLSRFQKLPGLASAIWDLPTAKTLTPHLTCRGALVASDWSSSYFDADPWETLNVEVVIPERNVPSEQWISDWEKCLDQWGLEPAQ